MKQGNILCCIRCFYSKQCFHFIIILIILFLSKSGYIPSAYVRALDVDNMEHYE